MATRGVKPTPYMERVAAKIVQEGECQIWTGRFAYGRPELDGKSIRSQLTGIRHSVITTCGNERCVAVPHLKSVRKLDDSALEDIRTRYALHVKHFCPMSHLAAEYGTTRQNIELIVNRKGVYESKS